jgi:gliding motility-associated-like protein
MKFWILLLILLLSSSLNRIHAQISGVINQYTPVTAILCDHIEVQDASFLSIGDRVLIIQMKGANINTSNTAAFGSVTNYNNCGHYEFATVTSLYGNEVGFQFSLLHDYEVAGKVQLIRVPQYTNVIVTNTLTAQDWNGNTGGVLVLEVSGTLTLNAPISVNGKGFRGAFSSQNPDGGCGNHTDYFYPVSSGFGAEKGEGIAEVNNTMNGGRGALGNGGGGGNKHNTGGGGGSNGSRGGRGGDQAFFCGQQPIGGEGGFAMDYSTGRLFMGGGGGSADFNDGVGSAGSNGGGIVIIRAATLQANNNAYIESCGGNVVAVSNSIGDGAGGGGAGGSIALDVNTFSGNLILRVDGGDGGNIQTSYPSCFGPGGGGGTGAIQYSGSVLPPANVTTSFVPGDPGINVSTNSNCANQPYGAAAGQFGPIYSFNTGFPESTQPFGTIYIGPDIEVCEQSVTITTNIIADSYLWSTGETTPYITVSTSGDYWLSVVYGPTSCSSRDTISVNLNSLSVDAGPDQVVCMGETITLNASSSGSTDLSWDNGAVNTIPFVPQTTTAYVVTATSSNGSCTASDTVLVTVNPSPVVAVNPSVSSGCAPLVVSFSNQQTNCASSTWTFSDGTVLSGCGNQSLTFDAPGCFGLSLEVISNEGCTASADFDSIVCVSASPMASFSPVPAILNNDNPTTSMINNSTGGNQYEWNFGDNTIISTLFDPVHSYSPGSFESYTIRLTVTNDEGCSDIAYGIVYMEGGSIYYVPNSFTPDGNEFNQIFRPVFAYGVDPTDYNFKVFNRWGEIVFESNDPEVGWDGTYHGSLAQEGIYTWRIEYGSLRSSEREIIHGHLNLLK